MRPALFALRPFCAPSFRRWLLPCLVFLAWPATHFAAAKNPWQPIPPEEISAGSPQIDPAAPAELLWWSIRIDDRQFPEERVVREYLRYKIFLPDKAEQLTRISGLVTSYDGSEMRETELRARLTLPNGTVTEYGPDAVRERSLMKTGGEQTLLQRLFGADNVEVKERFLAVTGLEAGAILEFSLVYTERNPSRFLARALQRDGVPIRKLEYIHQPSTDDNFVHRAFLSNLSIGHATFHEEPKKHTITVTASQVPASVHEPFSGGRYDHVLTVFSSHVPLDTSVITRTSLPSIYIEEAKTGPWSPIAGRVYMEELDRAVPTNRVRQLLPQIVGAATDPVEKARLIHLWVQAEHQKYLHRPRNKSSAIHSLDNFARSLDDVLNWSTNQDQLWGITDTDFLWLAITLYRLAGLETQTVVLPDRRLMLFNPRFVASSFLNHYCAALKIGDQLYFSHPHGSYTEPFGMLHWPYEGQVGLVAQTEKQRFIDVPVTPAEKSTIANSGNFTVAADGTLQGRGTRRWTGQAAFGLRDTIQRRPTRKNQILLAQLKNDFRDAEIRITKVDGIDTPEEPLEVAFTIRLRNFATVTQDRIVFRPSVFRLQSTSPFSASVRQQPVQFPYGWQELDEVTIQVPAGYTLESSTAPAPLPGKSLHYRTSISIERNKRLVHVQREFLSRIIVLDPSKYPSLKKWYDIVAAGDQHEVVFIRAEGAKPPPAAAPASPAVPAATPTPEPATP
jgi:hypothetical protein